MKKIFVLAFILLVVFCCAQKTNNEAVSVKKETPFVWEGANLYFLLQTGLIMEIHLTM